MKKTVLILTNTLWGVFNFRREVVDAIAEKGYDIILTTPDSGKSDFFIEKGYRVVVIPFDRKSKSVIADLKLLYSYYKLMKKEKPSVVLSYTIKPNIYGGLASRICHIPLIANITGLGTAVETPGKFQKMMLLLLKIGLKRATTVFFQNQENLEFFEKHHITYGRKILIPGSGVNINYHKLQDYPIEHPIKFIFIGRMLKEKGIELYLNAAEYLKQKYPYVEFHIVGSDEGHYKGKVEELQERGIVKYHGTTSDIRPFIGQSHCTVHPSYYPEGMSNVLLESCAAGRPVITTDKSGCCEIVEDGKTGFIVKQRDSEDLERKMETFLLLPYEQKKAMGLAARQKVKREFNREIVVKAYLSEIEDCAP